MANKTREKFVILIMGEGIKSPSPPAMRLFFVDENEKMKPIGHPFYYHEKEELHNRILNSSKKIQSYLLKKQQGKQNG
jgi:hypothetical protein